MDQREKSADSDGKQEKRKGTVTHSIQMSYMQKHGPLRKATKTPKGGRDSATIKNSQLNHSERGGNRQKKEQVVRGGNEKQRDGPICRIDTGRTWTVHALRGKWG